MNIKLFCTLFLLSLAAAPISALPVVVDLSRLRREVDGLLGRNHGYETVKRAALLRPRVKRLDSDLAQMGGWQMAGGIWG